MIQKKRRFQGNPDSAGEAERVQRQRQYRQDKEKYEAALASFEAENKSDGLEVARLHPAPVSNPGTEARSGPDSGRDAAAEESVAGTEWNLVGGLGYIEFRQDGSGRIAPSKGTAATSLKWSQKAKEVTVTFANGRSGTFTLTGDTMRDETGGSWRKR